MSSSRSFGSTVRRAATAIGFVALGTLAVVPVAEAQGRPAGTSSKKPRPKPDAKPKKHVGPGPARHADTGHADTALTPPPGSLPDLHVERLTLDNGLRVVLAPDRSLPSLAIAVAYGAGSSREAVGQQGAARLLASILQDAPTAALPEGASTRLIANLGGSRRAEADRDLVVFVDTLPSSALRLGLWLEAARMNGPQLTQDLVSNRVARQQAADTERTRVESLVYQGYWPYEHADDAMDPSNAFRSVHEFHRTWYLPSNAVVALAGNFDSAEAVQLIRTMWAATHASNLAEAHDLPSLPEQTNQRSSTTVVGPSAPQRLVEAWAVPPSSHDDLPALRMAAFILRDRTRLGRSEHAQRLRNLAPSSLVEASVAPRRGPSLWTMRLTVAPGIALDKERAIVDSAIDELGRLGPSTEEMRQAWRDAELDGWAVLDPVGVRAEALARAELSGGNAEHAIRSPLAMLKVTRDDVRKAVARYLSPTHRSVMEVRGPAPEPPHVAKPPTPQDTSAHHPGAAGGRRHPATPPPKKRPAPHPTKKKAPRAGGKRP